MKRESDTAKFVGHKCFRCGEPVRISAMGGYWSVDPKTGDVTGWHLQCVLKSAEERKA